MRNCITHGITNKGYSGMRSSFPNSIIMHLDNPESLTDYTIIRYLEQAVSKRKK